MADVSVGHRHVVRSRAELSADKVELARADAEPAGRGDELLAIWAPIHAAAIADRGDGGAEKSEDEEGEDWEWTGGEHGGWW